MKQTYVVPQVEMETIDTASVICLSGSGSFDDMTEIDYTWQ